MKNKIPAGVCLVFFTVFCSVSFAETINRIIAVVNDEIVTEGDLRFFMSSLSGGQKFKETEDILNDALEHLIDQRLIIQEAKRMGLGIEAQEISKKLDQIKATAASKEEYELMLKGAGITEEQLKNKLREQLLAQKAIDLAVRSRIVISPTDIAKASSMLPPDSAKSEEDPGQIESESDFGQNESKIYHILIRITDARPQEAAYKLANELCQRLLSGEDFEEVAKKYSEDSYASSGGLMGWVEQGQLLPKLDEAVAKLNNGETSGPILTPLGLHVIKVAQKRTQGDVKSQETRQKRMIQMRLYHEKFAKTMDEWVSGLRKRAYIEFLYDSKDQG